MVESPSVSNLTGPITAFNELELAGKAPDLDEYCSRYPEIPDLRERLLRIRELSWELKQFWPLLPNDRIEPPAEVAGFRVGEPIGEGGMGRVFLAQREGQAGPCALKIVRAVGAHEIERFEREVGLVAGLDHPGIAEIIDWGIFGDWAFIASELVNGFTIRALLKAAKEAQQDQPERWIVHALEKLAFDSPLHQTARLDGPLAAVQAIASQAAQALAHAHHKGVVHCDVKPSNIMLTLDGQVKVIDFGIAEPVRTDLAGIRATGAFVGTLDYAAPEQLHGDLRAIGAWTDVFGLAVTFFEMITLHTPFEGKSLKERIAEADDAPYNATSPYDHLVPEPLRSTILCALDPVPERRYQDGEQLAKALHRLNLPTFVGDSLPEETTIPVTVLPADEGSPVADSDSGLFEKAVLDARPRLDLVCGRGYLVAAVNRAGETVDKVILAANERIPVSAVIIGQHTRAHLRLTDDPELGRRHLLAWLTLEGRSRRLHVVDLNTSTGFVVEPFGRCESVATDGPLIIRVGEYSLVFIPTDNEYWPEDPLQAWRELPPANVIDARNGNAIIEEVFGPADEPSAGPAKTTLIARQRAVDYVSSNLRGVARRNLAGELIRPDLEPPRHFPIPRAELERGILLGRYLRCDPGAQLFAKATVVSVLHAYFVSSRGRTFIIDIASTNGILLDGRPVSAAEVPARAVIDIGRSNAFTWRAAKPR